MINLQAQGYKIIGSNILQSMLNEVGRCTLFYFVSIVRSSQVEKERKRKRKNIPAKHQDSVERINNIITLYLNIIHTYNSN